MLELMPDGETFKKLTKAQDAALDRHYKRQRPSLLDEAAAPLISTGLPIIAGTALAAIAYIFRDKLKDEADEFVGGVGQFINEGIWDSAVFPLMDLAGIWKDPKTPKMVLLNPEASPRDYTYAGPLTRCQRWETDFVEFGAKGGLDRAFILRRMIDESCDKPAAVEQGEWDRLKP
jgi:hypothetical protein